MTKLDRIFFAMLAFALCGYAVVGRGFAYLGVAPLFIGEIVLILGVAAVLSRIRRLSLPNSPCLWALLPFMLWCAVRTLPYVGRYGQDALRDAVLWGYALFAVVMLVLLNDLPKALPLLLHRYARFIPIFLIGAPLLAVAGRLLDPYLPVIPGTNATILTAKHGDQCVHLTGVLAYLSLLWTGAIPWIAYLAAPAILALSLVNRGGLVSFGIGAFVLGITRPRASFAWRLLLVGVIAIGVMWAGNFRFRLSPESPREISAEQLFSNLNSLLGGSGKEQLEGTKEWRLQWWGDIVDYTFGGRYFWTGKGFGVNLAEDDGYVVDEANSLRSPHNGHMTVLARAGVPGLVLWVLVQGTWIAGMIANYRSALRRGDGTWANLFLFLSVYWLAFMVNASFDVFLEGPLGGIWFWTVYGVGMGAIQLYQTSPELLRADAGHRSTQLLPAARRRRRGLLVGNATA